MTFEKPCALARRVRHSTIGAENAVAIVTIVPSNEREYDSGDAKRFFLHQGVWMDTATKPLEELIRELSPKLRAEVRDFVEFLLIKYTPSAGRTLRQDWAEALKNDQDSYDSVELQHQALKWRQE
jgi:hypothetical protein